MKATGCLCLISILVVWARLKNNKKIHLQWHARHATCRDHRLALIPLRCHFIYCVSSQSDQQCYCGWSRFNDVRVLMSKWRGGSRDWGAGSLEGFFFKTIKTNEVISPCLITCSQSENTVEIQWVTEKVEASFLALVLLRWRHLIAVAFFRLPPPGYLSHSDECNQRLKRSQGGGLKK